MYISISMRLCIKKTSEEKKENLEGSVEFFAIAEVMEEVANIDFLHLFSFIHPFIENVPYIGFGVTLNHFIVKKVSQHSFTWLRRRFRFRHRLRFRRKPPSRRRLRRLSED